MALEGVMLIRISQAEKDKYYMIYTYFWNLKANRDFPGGLWLGFCRLPMQAMWVRSLVRELKSHIPQLRLDSQINRFKNKIKK